MSVPTVIEVCFDRARPVFDMFPSCSQYVSTMLGRIMICFCHARFDKKCLSHKFLLKKIACHKVIIHGIEQTTKLLIKFDFFSMEKVKSYKFHI